MIPAWYRRGTATVAAGTATWLVVDAAADSDLVLRCWGVLAADGRVDDLIDALVSGGVRAMPAFALLGVLTGHGRIVVHGAAHAVVATAAGPRTIASATDSAWTDVPTGDDAVAVTLQCGATDNVGALLPLVAGIVTAGAITVGLSAGQETTAAAESTLLSGSDPVDAGSARRPGSLPATSLAQADSGSTAGETEDDRRDRAPEEQRILSYDYLLDPAQRGHSAGDAGAVMPRPHGEPGVERPAADAGGAPVPLSVIQAANQPPMEADGRTIDPAPGTVHEALPSAVSAPSSGEIGGRHTQSAVVTPTDAGAAPATSGLIDAVPWSTSVAASIGSIPAAPTVADPTASPHPNPAAAPRSGPAADVAPPIRALPSSQPVVPPAGDLDDSITTDLDRTVSRAALVRDAPPPAGPTVLAGYCPSGHLSPPFAATCRVCRQPMPRQDAFEIPRPALGVLRLPSGDTVVVDRPILIGRAPVEPPDVAERPSLLRLDSPDKEISRNHAEVVIDGWYTYVRDLGSTNGTVVTLPGQQPTRLREGDLQLLEAGAVITLADIVRITFQVTAG